MSSIKNLYHNSKFTVLGLAVLILGATIALIVSQQRQENRSRAEVSAQKVYKATDNITSETEVVPGEVLIKLKSSANQAVPDRVSVNNLGRESLRQLSRAVRAERVERVLARRNNIPAQNQPETAWYKIKATTSPNIPKSVSSRLNKSEFDRVLAMVDQYKKDPDVEIAEPNYVVRHAATPNDPYYSSRGFFTNYDDLWGLKKINMSSAWDYTSGNNVVVAVIDTGVDRNHPDLQANMWKDSDGSNGWDFVNNDNDPQDDNGHGTHVAGILGASGNNGRQIPGVNWQVKIMSVKVMDHTGFGTFDNLAKGLKYAADKGAKISNASISGEGSSQILEDAVNYEHDRGMAVVVAAGNNNTDVSNSAPANTTKAIAVGATDPNDQKASFSNFGAKIDVVAPGVDILSIMSNVSPLCGVTSGGYEYVCYKNGTSVSAPQVAGLAALMLSKKPSLTNEDIRQVLRSSSRDLGPAGQDPDFGYGLIDAGRAMAQVDGGSSTSPTPPSPTPPPPSASGPRLDIFAKGTDNQMWHKWWDGIRWNGWEGLGGQLSSAPSATSRGERIDVFARNSSNQLIQKWWDGVRWNGWLTFADTTFIDDPSVVARGSSNLDVFMRGSDNALKHKWWNGSDWNGWEDLGGELASAPSATSWGQNRLDVFIKGTDNQLWHKWWDGSKWNDWEELGGQLASAPSVASWAPNRLDIFAKGTDNQLWHKWWDGSKWAWEEFGSPSGGIGAAPIATSWGPNRLDVFVKGNKDNQIWHKWWDGSKWNGWESLGAPGSFGSPSSSATIINPTGLEPGQTFTASVLNVSSTNSTYILRIATSAAGCPGGQIIGGAVISTAVRNINPVNRIMPLNQTSGTKYVCFVSEDDSTDYSPPTKVTVF